MKPRDLIKSILLTRDKKHYLISFHAPNEGHDGPWPVDFVRREFTSTGKALDQRRHKLESYVDMLDEP